MHTTGTANNCSASTPPHSPNTNNTTTQLLTLHLRCRTTPTSTTNSLLPLLRTRVLICSARSSNRRSLNNKPNNHLPRLRLARLSALRTLDSATMSLKLITATAVLLSALLTRKTTTRSGNLWSRTAPHRPSVRHLTISSLSNFSLVSSSGYSPHTHMSLGRAKLFSFLIFFTLEAANTLYRRDGEGGPLCISLSPHALFRFLHRRAGKRGKGRDNPKCLLSIPSIAVLFLHLCLCFCICIFCCFVSNSASWEYGYIWSNKHQFGISGSSIAGQFVYSVGLLRREVKTLSMYLYKYLFHQRSKLASLSLYGL
jgi:hypothetical protein